MYDLPKHTSTLQQKKMSNILSYNSKTTGDGWIQLTNQYSQDEIEAMEDPNGGLSQQPRTAIPSPFAQMDLVKNAFYRLSMYPKLDGELMDRRLVANALDIAQLFFNYPELKGKLKIVIWNKAVQIQQLKMQPEHRLFGETLEMFLQQDAGAFNFDKMDRLYFLVYGNQVIGGTSPASLFMASPDARENTFPIPVEQNVNLFDAWHQLNERNPKFVRYIYAIFTAYPELKKMCSEVNRYLMTAFHLLAPYVREDILKDIGNPEVLDMSNVDRARNYLEGNYTRMDEGVECLGIPLYCARLQDITASISESDFMIVPSNDVDDRLPLVLQNCLNAPATDPFTYITGIWDDSIEITRDDYALPPEKRVLPATSHQYPWLTADDFFQPSLIKLDYGVNRDCFFDGNLSIESRDADSCDFVLPLKPLYFKYFKASDLWGTINGRPRFEMIHSKIGQSDTLKAILRVPVKKSGHFVTLTRTYIESADGDLRYDVGNDQGRFITVPFALSIFPFVKASSLRQYNVQLVDRALGQLDNSSLSLDFYHDGFNQRVEDDKVVSRDRSLKSEKRVGSRYYRIASDFDFIGVNLTNDQGNIAAQGIICPRWADYIPGHDAFTFAVDFGTTNTHVEFMQGNDMPQPFLIDSQSRERLLATLYSGESILYDVIIKQEFLPGTIGADYGFPQRTVLSECERLDAENVDEILALGDANIPFIYEKESTGYGNRIEPNLKWSTQPATSKRIRAFIKELALLMRTKVLLGNGDIAKTRLVWFYPLSMKVGNVRKMSENWAKTFADVFGIEATASNLIHMPESVAPYYFYKSLSNFRGAASTVTSIDIGGGSSDVVVYEPNAASPAMLTSFRFAANVLFGDGFSEIPHGDSNPMLVKYVDYFKRLFDSDDDKYGELNGILDDITAKRKSEDISAFLFSVINNKVVQGNDVFSYNKLLNEDGVRKIIFIYFYSTLIYYVACMMRDKKLNKPGCVMFSGTGSKVLDIVGGQDDLNILTQSIFERVYGEKYDNNGFSVVMEKKEPKQITCRGALMQVRDSGGCANIDTLNRLMNDLEHPLKQNYSMIQKTVLTYDDMDDPEIRKQIVDEVKRFNEFFIQLCDDIHVIDRFLVETSSLTRFRDLVDLDLEHHLLNGWNFMNKNQDEKRGGDTIEDSVFFYPIIGSIRDNLIEKLL
jgi:hypothetical protein